MTTDEQPWRWKLKSAFGPLAWWVHVELNYPDSDYSFMEWASIGYDRIVFGRQDRAARIADRIGARHARRRRRRTSRQLTSEEWRSESE